MLIKIGDFWVRPDAVRCVGYAAWLGNDREIGALAYVDGIVGDVSGTENGVCLNAIGVQNETAEQLQERVNSAMQPRFEAVYALDPGRIQMIDDCRDYRTWIQCLRDWWRAHAD